MRLFSAITALIGPKLPLFVGENALRSMTHGNLVLVLEQMNN
jgi:hypothetical protein